MQAFQALLTLVACTFIYPMMANAAPRDVDGRAVCNHDNVLRALLRAGAAATGFCSTYINIKDVTVTVLGTHPPPTPITETTATQTITAFSYPSQYTPYLLPTYLFSYPTPSRISSGCTCLSIHPSTYTDFEYYPTPTATTVTTTTTVPGLTDACATETLYPGAFKLGSSASDAFEYSIGVDNGEGATYPDFAVPNCCSACSSFTPFPNGSGSPREGFFGNCIGFRVDANRNCTLLLQGSVGAGYLGPKCAVDGYQPGTLSVNPTKYPFAVGGEGQCASSFTTIAS